MYNKIKGVSDQTFLFMHNEWNTCPQWFTDKSLNFVAIRHADLVQGHSELTFRGSQQYAQWACSINLSLVIECALSVFSTTWHDFSHLTQEQPSVADIFLET